MCLGLFTGVAAAQEEPPASTAPEAVTTTSSTSTESATDPCLERSAQEWWQKARGNTRDSYPHSDWRDSTPAPSGAKARFRTAEDCIPASAVIEHNGKTITGYTEDGRVKAQAKLWRHRHSYERSFYEYRGWRLHIQPYACGGGRRAAVPCYIVQCESQWNYRAQNSSSSASGLYQDLYSTWHRYGGGRFASEAWRATPLQQHIVNHRVSDHSRHFYQWACA